MFFIIPIFFEIIFFVVFVAVVLNIIKSMKRHRQSERSMKTKNEIEENTEPVIKEKSHTYCVYCGAQIENSRKKCPSCGAKITQIYK